jgi:hypothetical protein
MAASNDLEDDLDDAMQALMENKGEIERLLAENERLTTCLRIANNQTEHFEREWYLRGFALEALRAENEALRTACESAREALSAI